METKNRIANSFVQNYTNSQCVAAMLPALENLNHPKFNNLCYWLSTQLPIMERSFALGEALVAIGSTNCWNSLKQNQTVSSMLTKVKSTKYTKQINSVFQLNWDIQALVSFKIQPSNHYINTLFYIVESSNLSSLETNYLAVMWEALCHLKLTNKKETTRQELCLKLLVELLKRISRTFESILLFKK